MFQHAHGTRQTPGDTLPRARGHHAPLRHADRERPRRSRNRPGPDPRAARRKRRRQVDTDENHLRRAAGRRGHDPLAGRARDHRRPPRRARLGHRHGVPAFLAVRRDDGGRERGPRPRCPRAPAGAGHPHPRGQPRIRPAARSRPHRGLAGRGRAPARRDRPLPDHAAPPAGDGRAHLGAHPAGGRAAVRDAAAARGRRRLGPLHFAQAGRDPGTL